MTSNTVSRLLNFAADVAQKSPLKYQHGCCIYKGKKKIASGFNHDRSTHRGEHCCSFHAEKAAVTHLMSVLFGSKETPCLL